MKKLLIIMIIFIAGLNAHCSETLGIIQRAYYKRIKFYPLYFNSLQLTQEQISEFEYITEKYNNLYKQNLEDKVKLKKLSEQEDKEIIHILDKRQKSQFKIIKHLEKLDIKRSFKEKDYYKSNPRMSVFGDINKK